MCNFIKIDRKILQWEWWSDVNTFRVFTYMLLCAYWKDGNYKGTLIPRGAFPSSIPELAKATNLTENEIRTALKHLKSTGEITGKSTNKFTVFTINNYDSYQTINRQDYRQTTGKITDNAQANHRQTTGTILKEVKNIEVKNIKNIKEKEKEINKEKEKEILRASKDAQVLADFEILYKSYPVKRGRESGFTRYKLWLKGKRTSNGTIRLTNAQMWDAIKRYKESMNGDYTYACHFDTFMNTKILDWIGEDET